MNKRIILTSAMSLVIAVSMIFGATFALFTSKSETNIAVTSGTVKVNATVAKAENDWIYSPTLIAADGSEITDPTNAADLDNGVFANKGTASVEGNTVKLTNATPGDKVNFVVNIENKSNVAIKYRTMITASNGALKDVVVVEIDHKAYTGTEIKNTWLKADPMQPIASFPVSIELPIGVNGDAYEGQEMTFGIVVEAVQANADTTEEITAEEVGTLTEFAQLLKDTAASGQGKDVVIQLTKDFAVDTENGESWTELGAEVVFSGVKSLTIEGMDHTITGIDAPLLVGAVGGAFTVKDLTLDKANIVKPGYNGLGVGAFLGYTDVAGNVTFDTCKVTNSTITCTTDASAGGFVGNFSSTHELRFYDCEVNNCDITAVSNAGGFIGLSYASKTTVNNSKVVDARITATEDGASWRVGYVAGTLNNTAAVNSFSNVTVSGGSLTMTNPAANNITDNRNGEYCNLFGRAWNTVIVNSDSFAANQR